MGSFWDRPFINDGLREIFDADQESLTKVTFIVNTHYNTASRWYAPNVLAKINDSKIERVTEMGIKKKLLL